MNYPVLRGFGPRVAYAPASAQSFNSPPRFLERARPVYKEVSAPAPIQVRKSFPESWIFDDLDKVRYLTIFL